MITTVVTGSTPKQPNLKPWIWDHGIIHILCRYWLEMFSCTGFPGLEDNSLILATGPLQHTPNIAETWNLAWMLPWKPGPGPYFWDHQGDFWISTYHQRYYGKSPKIFFLISQLVNSKNWLNSLKILPQGSKFQVLTILNVSCKRGGGGGGGALLEGNF